MVGRVGVNDKLLLVDVCGNFVAIYWGFNK